MPIYEYVCKSCGHELDALQKMSEDPLTDCPDCGRSELRRKISAPRFRLKGSGWYETDFKTDRDKKRNLADGGEKAAGEKSAVDGEKKTEGKSEAKGEKKTGTSKTTGTPGGGEAA